jgi:hypothetical protein
MPNPVLLYAFSPDKVSRSLGGDNAIDSLIDLHGLVVISKTGGLNNHGVGVIANKNNLIRFDVDDLPWSTR